MDGQNLHLKWAEFGERLTVTLFLSGEEDDSAWVVFLYLLVFQDQPIEIQWHHLWRLQLADEGILPYP